MSGNNEARQSQRSNVTGPISGECLSDPQGLEALAYNTNAIKTNSHQGTARERIKRIIEDAGKRHGVTYNEIMSPCRFHRFAVARQEAMVEVGLAFPNLSFPHLGRIFKRDHSTVMFAFEKCGVPKRMANPNWAKQYAEARQQVAVGSTQTGSTTA